jgi:Tfp pilus assembly protein PilV
MEFGEVFQQFFIQVVFPIIGAGILALLGNLIKKLSEKFDGETTSDLQTSLEEMIVNSIAFAEEYAANRLKNSNVKTSGNEKLDQALCWLAIQAPKVDRNEARLWIEAMLARVKGAGATGDDTIMEKEIKK